jgi:glycosyltransferase involved in cell wall biosynthesis
MAQNQHVLLVTRPIALPWNESSKNLSYALASRGTRYTTHVMTVRGRSRLGDDHIVEEPVYTDDRLMTGVLPLPQKARVLKRLCKPDPSIGIYHFFMAPKYYQTRIFDWVAGFKRKRSLQSIICMISGKEADRRLFFGDEIVVFSDHTKTLVERLAGRSVVKIDPGIEVSRYPARVDERSARASFAFGDRKTVLYCGDYTVEQGPRKLVDAVPELIKAVPEALVVFAARGKTAGHLQEKKLVTERIAALGVESHVKVLDDEWRIPELIVASDVGILPADAILRKLDIPLLLLEFLASGKPIVVNDIAPLNEIMRDEVGALLRYNRPDEIAGALTALLRDREKRRRLGIAGRALAERDFSVDSMTRKFEAVYDRLTGRSSS